MGQMQEQVRRLRVQLPERPARTPERVLFVDLVTHLLRQKPQHPVCYLECYLPISLASRIPADKWGSCQSLHTGVVINAPSISFPASSTT